ncbi:MAG TPA: antitoxin [Gammaproteobacteria bacterium]|jgi:predicted DNA binding CopG/RHH family protein|nr:antitoxin [Gammaproteobacteria bacterium]
MKKKHLDIEQQEKEILEDLENDEFVSVDNLNEEMRLAKKAAFNYVKRDNRINIRISGADLNMVRRIAVREGLPYQTLLASVIHKFVSGQLIDKGNFSEK